MNTICLQPRLLLTLKNDSCYFDELSLVVWNTHFLNSIDVQFFGGCCVSDNISVSFLCLQLFSSHFQIFKKCTHLSDYQSPVGLEYTLFFFFVLFIPPYLPSSTFFLSWQELDPLLCFALLRLWTALLFDYQLFSYIVSVWLF